MVQGIPTKLTSVDVLLEPVTVWAISFQPDLPVETRMKRARPNREVIEADGKSLHT